MGSIWMFVLPVLHSSCTYEAHMRLRTTSWIYVHKFDNG